MLIPVTVTTALRAHDPGRPLWKDILAGVLATLIALVIAGISKWAVERRRAKHPRFVCRARQSEHPRAVGIQANQTAYFGNVELCVDVVNDGPTGDFYARLRDFEGMPSLDYQVPLPLWKHTTETRTTIPGHGGQRVIELANVARRPYAVWFNTSENGKREAGTQWPLSEDTSIRFEFEVGRVGEKRDELRRYRGEIFVPMDGSLPTFTLTPK